MNNSFKKVKSMILVIIVLITTVLINIIHAEVYYIPNNNPYHSNYNPNYYPYNSNYPYNQYNPYANPNGIYGFSQDGAFLIPYDAIYYMVGYDRNAYVFAGGEVMQSRVPVLGGNYQYPTQIANRLIYNAYLSISNWCNENIYNDDRIQDYYLNNASVYSVTPTEVVLIVNCALKKKGIIDGSEEFRVTINIQAGRFIWRKLSNKDGWLYGDSRIYEFDSSTGRVIIIQ